MPPRLPNGLEPQDPPVRDDRLTRFGDGWIQGVNGFPDPLDALNALRHGGAGQPLAVEPLAKLPNEVSFDVGLNRQFQGAADFASRQLREMDYTMKLGRDGREFLTNRKIGSPAQADAGFTTDATAERDFHAHTPTLRGSQWYPGSAPSGTDIAQLINSPSATSAIVQAGPRQYMVMKSRETPSRVDLDELKAEVKRRSDYLHAAMPTMSWIDATEQAAKEEAAKYSLGYYEGRDGRFRRVPLPPHMP